MATTRILFGRNVLEEALALKIPVTQIMTENDGAEAFARKLYTERRMPMPPFRKGLPRELRESSHQGIAFEVKHDFYVDERHFDLAQCKFVLMCNHLEDAQNLGAIVRSAVAFGVDLIIHESRRSVDLNATAVKVSAGQAFRMKFLEVGNLLTSINDLQKLEFQVVALDMREDAISLYEWEPRFPIGLIVGSEGEGVAAPLLKKSECVVSIPMKPNVESLNAAQSATLAMSWAFEGLRRQKL